MSNTTIEFPSELSQREPQRRVHQPREPPREPQRRVYQPREPQRRVHQPREPQREPQGRVHQPREPQRVFQPRVHQRRVFQPREPERMVPTETMIDEIQSIVRAKFGSKEYKNLSIDEICELLFDLLTNITECTEETLHTNINAFYCFICDQRMPSLMTSRKDIKNQNVLNVFDSLNLIMYSHPKMVNLLSNTFMKELFVIGVNQLYKEYPEHLSIGDLSTDGFWDDLRENCISINEASTLTTKFNPDEENCVLNINGGYGQGSIVPSILSNSIFFNLLYGNYIKFDEYYFDNSAVYPILTDEEIEVQSLFVSKLFMVASFGFVRKLLEVLFGYKAFTFFDNTSETKRGLPSYKSNKYNERIFYTEETLHSRIREKMIEILKNSEKSVTIQLWTKCYKIAFLLFEGIV
jgi:hypothetical protein